MSRIDSSSSQVFCLSYEDRKRLVDLWPDEFLHQRVLSPEELDEVVAKLQKSQLGDDSELREICHLVRKQFQPDGGGTVLTRRASFRQHVHRVLDNTDSNSKKSQITAERNQQVSERMFQCMPKVGYAEDDPKADTEKHRASRTQPKVLDRFPHKAPSPGPAAQGKTSPEVDRGRGRRVSRHNINAVKKKIEWWETYACSSKVEDEGATGPPPPAVEESSSRPVQDRRRHRKEGERNVRQWLEALPACAQMPEADSNSHPSAPHGHGQRSKTGSPNVRQSGGSLQHHSGPLFPLCSSHHRTNSPPANYTSPANVHGPYQSPSEVQDLCPDVAPHTMPLQGGTRKGNPRGHSQRQAGTPHHDRALRPSTADAAYGHQGLRHTHQQYKPAAQKAVPQKVSPEAEPYQQHQKTRQPLKRCPTDGQRQTAADNGAPQSPPVSSGSPTEDAMNNQVGDAEYRDRQGWQSRAGRVKICCFHSQRGDSTVSDIHPLMLPLLKTGVQGVQGAPCQTPFSEQGALLKSPPVGKNSPTPDRTSLTAENLALLTHHGPAPYTHPGGFRQVGGDIDTARDNARDMGANNFKEDRHAGRPATPATGSRDPRDGGGARHHQGRPDTPCNPSSHPSRPTSPPQGPLSRPSHSQEGMAGPQTHRHGFGRPQLATGACLPWLWMGAAVAFN